MELTPTLILNLALLIVPPVALVLVFRQWLARYVRWTVALTALCDILLFWDELFYSTKHSRKVQELYEQGCTIQEIMDRTGLKRASVHSYLPYTKGNYNLPELPLNAERRRAYRRRIAVCERLMQEINSPNAEECLWDAILAFAGYPFVTEKGLPLKYTVEGGEIFFNRKEKSVTRATVMRAFHQARTIQESEGCVSGPKKLGTFGASYLYPVFLRIGVCSKKSEIF